MKIQDKLRTFDEHDPKLHLFQEGIFAKLYNESAFLFTRHVRKYKVNVTDCKRGHYYSIGFPDSLLVGLLESCPGYEMIDIDPDYRICTHPDFRFDPVEYAEWCRQADCDTESRAGKSRVSTVPASSASSASASSGAEPSAGCSGAASVPGDYRSLVAEIICFRLENATPLECMLFIQNIQKKCYGLLPELTALQRGL